MFPFWKYSNNDASILYWKFNHFIIGLGPLDRLNTVKMIKTCRIISFFNNKPEENIQ